MQHRSTHQYKPILKRKNQVVHTSSPRLMADYRILHKFPQWGAADAEIKVPFGENTELKRSPLKAWSL